MIFLLRKVKFHLFRPPGFHLLQSLFSAGNGKFFFIKQFLDFQDQLQVFPAVEALLRVRAAGGNDFEFRFPVTQNIGFNAGDVADFTDLIIELLGDRNGFFSFHGLRSPWEAAEPKLPLWDEVQFVVFKVLRRTWLGLKVKTRRAEI